MNDQHCIENEYLHGATLSLCPKQAWLERDFLNISSILVFPQTVSLSLFLSVSLIYILYVYKIKTYKRKLEKAHHHRMDIICPAVAI